MKDVSNYTLVPTITREQYMEDMKSTRVKQEKRTIQENKVVITCPYCKSTDTKKISATSRWFSTGLFGLSSGKIGKQWHCNKCRSDF